MTASHPLILAIGDSLVAGYGLKQADSFPGRLQARLRPTYPDVEVINAGVSGDTAAGVLRRLPGLLSRHEARPDLAIVQVGPNDVLRQVPPPMVRASLEAIVIELGRCGIPVLLTTVEPPAVLRGRAAAYLGLHQEVATANGAVTAPFFPEGVLGNPAMVLADRMHPNVAAIAAVVETMLPTVTDLIEGRLAPDGRANW